MTLLERVRDRIGESELETLSPAERAEIEATAADLEDLLVRFAGGEDVAGPLAECRATILQWRSVGLSRGQAATLEAFTEFVQEALAVLIGVVL